MTCAFLEQRGKPCAEFASIILWCRPCRAAKGLCELCGKAPNPTGSPMWPMRGCDCVEHPTLGKMLREWADRHPEEAPDAA